MLASCHTVTVTLDPEGNTFYTSTSPDEMAIINFAKFAGVEYLRLDKVGGDTFIILRQDGFEHSL